MKRFKEIIFALISLLGVILATIFAVSKHKAKTPDQIDEELKVKKEQIEADYEKEKAELLMKPPEETIQEYYEELDKIKDVEIQEAVDEAMLLAEEYRRS